MAYAAPLVARPAVVRAGLSFLFVLCLTLLVQGQSATYHLHKESSTTSGLFQLKTAGPDGTSLAITSANLKNVAAGEYLIKAFDTQSGDPIASGTIPAGSNITFALWLRKTTTGGTMFPRAKLQLNSAAGTLLGTATGATALTNTLAKYTFSVTTSSNIVMTASDRFYIWVGVNVTAAPTTNTNAELDVEGTLNGNFDSTVVVPLPLPTPSISSLSPQAGPIGTGVTINGSTFGATQGTSTVTFNGVAATPTNWTNTSIVAPVPAGATTGPVIVTVGGIASNGVTFSVGNTGTITGTLTRSSDGVGINGGLIEALQSGIVKGSATSATNGSYSIVGLVSGTYDVRASANRYVTQVQAGVVVSAPGSTAANFSLVDVGPITNIYDELGRLVAVVDPAGDTVTYSYDSVGNVLSIVRGSSSQLSILEFSPNKAPIGSPVTIYGTAFSQTPSQNVVKFNGTVAVVSSSTSTQISTTVPVGATTGTISVTTPSGTVTSSTPFTVGSDAPIITSFTPTIGTAGTSVNISGSNFDSATYGNRVEFNGTRSIVTAASPTSLTTSVPTGATSGRISNTTPAGKGVSSNYFFIPPDPFTAADVEIFTTMNIGESKTVTISTANKVAIVLFDGLAGQRVSLRMTGVTISSSSVSIRKPDGSTFGSTSVNTSGGFIDAQTLPTSGTYTILIDPSSTNTGNMTLELYAVADVTGTITPGGTAVTVTTTIPGQNAQLTFAGTAGQRVSVTGANATFGACWNLGIYKPDGSQLTNTFSCGSTAFIEPLVLPVTGNYVLLIDSTGSAIGQATVNLYDVVDITGSISPGGPAVPITITTPGQVARLTFTGSAGQRVSINATGSFGACWNLGIYKPDGTQLANTFSCGGSAFIEPQVLAESGSYTVVIDPTGAAVGGSTATLFEVNDFTGSITTNGGSVLVLLPTPGQNARLTFDGTAGQRISANATGATFNGCWNFGIYKPDGTQLANTFSCGGSAFVEPQLLPVSGTYTLVVDPSGAVTGQTTVNLYEVTDVTGSITANGASVLVPLPTPGQTGRLTFEGTSGQRISANATAATFNGCWNFGIYKPDGTQLANTFSCGGSAFVEPQLLPVSGTYTLVVDPSGAATGQTTVNLYEANDVAGAIIANGASVLVALPTPGQNGRLTFDGTSGQRISANATAGTFTGCWNFGIYKPDGTQLANTFSCGGSAFVEPQLLPVSGTYTLVIDPSGSATGQTTVNLYEANDVAGAIIANGASVLAALPTPGQNARLTFDGTAGQRMSANAISGTFNGCWNLGIYKPDGTQLANTFSCGGTAFVEPQLLPVSGIYTVVVDPSGAATGQATVNLYNVVDGTGSITLGGAAVNVSITVPGQKASFTMSGTVGQQATVRVTSNTMSCVTVTLLKPDGTSLTNTFSCSGAFNLATQTLPVTGTYTITVDPNGSATGSMSLSVTNP
jgi:YD repeat-containing protein